MSVSLSQLIAQPNLVNSTPFAQEVSTIAYDSVNNKVFYNIAQGCPTWNIPCVLSYTPSLSNLIVKYDFTDNNFNTSLNSNFMVDPPSYPVNDFSSSIAKKSVFEQGNIYTNFGYYFNKIDTTNLSTIWSYSVNSGFKELSAFVIKSDSVFLLQRDSSSGKNYYGLILKNKLTGSNLIYNSLLASNPANSLGAIEGRINSALIINQNIVLSGVFTASISGNFVARNLVSINISTGQLQVPSVSFSPLTAIYDLHYNNNKVYVAGRFASINSQSRKNYAVLDANLNLLSDTLQFEGPLSLLGTWLDNIAFYDNYLIAKGYFNKINNTVLSTNSSYSIRVVNLANNSVMPWTINLPPGGNSSDGYTFQQVKNKLYLKKRGTSSAFYVYCFDPIVYATNILIQGNGLIAKPKITVCVPESGNTITYIAPIKYASTYNWNFAGSNGTVVPIGNGSSAKLILAANATNGLLSVTGTNDCGFSTPPISINVITKQKPMFSLPTSPQLIKCNPDSTLLNVSTTNTNALIWWREVSSNSINPQPFYTKTPGNYYAVVLDALNNCRDSTIVKLINSKVKPNSKITSHVYQGVLTPIDTVTCFKPIVTITAGSDTAGVLVTWKSIATNSVFPNPLNISAQNNLKVIATRTLNNCIDSSLIVLVNENKIKPNIVITTPSPSINCSYYTTSLNVSYSPTSCAAQWTSPTGYKTSNPFNTSTPGKHLIRVVDPSNGCAKVDSVVVTSSNKIVLNSTKDTTICKQTPAILNTMALGSITGVIYSWGPMTTGPSITVTPSITTQYIVTASGPNGCTGKDTIKVIVPPDIQDSVLTFKSCSDNVTGTIVLYANGGVAPYYYSINNGASFSSSNSFTHVAFGNYNIVIKDSIGCTRSSTVDLNPATSSVPTPTFLASTHNFKTDSIVLVDISVPKADSVHWLLPTQATMIGGSMFTPIIAVNDTGQFFVTMRAFYGSCVIDVTKPILFMQQDSLHAKYGKANGIKTFSLYPNPNTGQFTVFVEFYKKQNLSIQAWDTSPYKYLQQNFYDVDTITLPVDLSQLQNGNYILRVIGEYDTKNKTFIISK